MILCDFYTFKGARYYSFIWHRAPKDLRFCLVVSVHWYSLIRMSQCRSLFGCWVSRFSLLFTVSLFLTGIVWKLWVSWLLNCQLHDYTAPNPNSHTNWMRVCGQACIEKLKKEMSVRTEEDEAIAVYMYCKLMLI